MIQVTQAYRTRYSGTALTSYDQHEITNDAIVLAATCIARAIGKNQDEVTDIGYQAEDAYQDRFSNKDFNGIDDECRRLRINIWTDAYLTALGIKQSEDPTEVADSVLALYDKRMKKDESGSTDDGSAGDGTDSPQPDENEAYEAGRQEMMDRIDEEEELEEENADYEDERQNFEHEAQEANPDEDAYDKYQIGHRAGLWFDQVNAGEHPKEAIEKGKQAYLSALRRGDKPAQAGDSAIEAGKD